MIFVYVSGLSLAAVAIALVAANAASSQNPTFEVASVKRATPDGKTQSCLCEPPGRIAYRSAPLKWIIERAFNLQASQIAGPDWLDTDRFNIDAELPEQASRQQIPLMLRTLLADRFHLTAHIDKKELASYILTIGKDGTKLAPPKEGWEFKATQNRTGIHLQQRTNMDDFAAYLSRQLEMPVANETGLQGILAVKLDFAPDMLAARAEGRVDLAPLLPDALQHQLGLKLESKRRPVEVLVIDHVDKAPSEN